MAYNYNIDKYDVTNGQYTEFFNAVAATDTYGLYNAAMATNGGIADNSGAASGSKVQRNRVIGNQPVNYVSCCDAARFANWLNNGQPTGAKAGRRKAGPTRSRRHTDAD